MTKYTVTLEIETTENPNWIIDSIMQVLDPSESVDVVDIVEMEDDRPQAIKVSNSHIHFPLYDD